MSKKVFVTPTAFVNVLVTAIPTVDTKTGNITYATTFSPDAVRVRQNDTVISYQLVEPTPKGVRIASVDVKPEHSGQVSTPTISTTGKIATFIDANTAKENFNITLHFEDSDGIKFSVDPEVGNDPEPNPTYERVAKLSLYPEVGNDPEPNPT